jgi:hypothetical protein
VTELEVEEVERRGDLVHAAVEQDLRDRRADPAGEPELARGAEIGGAQRDGRPRQLEIARDRALLHGGPP